MGKQPNTLLAITLRIGGGALLVLVALAGCLSPNRSSVHARRALGPEGMPVQELAREDVAGAQGIAGPFAGETPVRIIDTRTLAHRPELFDVPTSRQRAVRDILPPHERPGPTGGGEQAMRGASDAPVSLMLDETRSEVLALFPGPAQTEWRPPDPNLAVGPSHIVATVNMALTIQDKQTGELQFAIPLNNYGSPGLFEGQGAQWFVFDPKCTYDHVAQRFVVIALETYASPFGAWINIAISDDSDPHGVWYTYRTNAAIGGGWWDYPSLGYDAQAWYVTGNLIGGGGVGIRVFKKQPMLSGGTAQFNSFTASGFTSQAASHFGSNAAGYIATLSGNQLRLLAITNPATTPALVTASVTVPSYGGGGNLATPADVLGNLTGDWLMNAVWRNGMLYTTQAAGGGAAWYQVNTGTWPVSGLPTLVQSGLVNPNTDGVGGMGVAFPAIAVNALGDLGIVMNVSSANMNPSVAVAGRLATDPFGTFGRVRIVHTGTSPEGQRWGDYCGIAVDPVDDLTFWGIGEYKDTDPASPTPGNARWRNWITSFAAVAPSMPFATVDDVGVLASAGARTIDVLANDFIPAGQTGTILNFTPASALDGTVTIVAGGPGGRQQLRYVAPSPGISDPSRAIEDSFSYTLRTSAGQEAVGTVRASIHDASRFLYPGTPPSTTAPGWRVQYYELSSPISFPDFAGLVPYATTTLSDINFGSGEETVLTSGRTDDVGMVADGWCNVSTDALYRFLLGGSEGARLYVGGQLIVDNSGPNSSILDRMAWVGLRAGWHPIRVEYYERYERAGLNFYSQPSVNVVHATESQDSGCDSIDFNRDGSIFDPEDFDSFLSVFAEGPCLPAGASCNDIDFNNDGALFDPCDVASFLLRFSEGPCRACGE